MVNMVNKMGRETFIVWMKFYFRVRQMIPFKCIPSNIDIISFISIISTDYHMRIKNRSNDIAVVFIWYDLLNVENSRPIHDGKWIPKLYMVMLKYFQTISLISHSSANIFKTPERYNDLKIVWKFKLGSKIVWLLQCHFEN